MRNFFRPVHIVVNGQSLEAKSLEISGANAHGLRPSVVLPEPVGSAFSCHCSSGKNSCLVFKVEVVYKL